MSGIGLAQEMLAFQEGLSSIELARPTFPTSSIPLESDVFATCGYIQDVSAYDVPNFI
jgi:hypothetical protein